MTAVQGTVGNNSFFESFPGSLAGPGKFSGTGERLPGQTKKGRTSFATEAMKRQQPRAPLLAEA